MATEQVTSEDVVCGEVQGVWQYPGSGQMMLDILETGRHHTTPVMVVTDDSQSKLTVNDRTVDAEDLLSFLYKTRKPQAKLVRDRMRYGAVLEAEFRS